MRYSIFFLWTVQRGLGPRELPLQLRVEWQNTSHSGLTQQVAPAHPRASLTWSGAAGGRSQNRGKKGGKEGMKSRRESSPTYTPSSLQAGPPGSLGKLRLEWRVGLPRKGEGGGQAPLELCWLLCLGILLLPQKIGLG